MCTNDEVSKARQLKFQPDKISSQFYLHHSLPFHKIGIKLCFLEGPGEETFFTIDTFAFQRCLQCQSKNQKLFTFSHHREKGEVFIHIRPTVWQSPLQDQVGFTLFLLALQLSV